VTEYGIANIAGKSIRERTLAIIDIAHPDHRDALIRQAKENGYIYADQIYVTEYAANYPFSMETVKTFANNQEIKFRPIKPSDEDMMRRLFYDFSDESKFMRYFTPIRIMPHIKMQPYVNVDYDTVVSIVGTIQHKGRERIISEARYSFDKKRDKYEMAFVVDDEFQGIGIAKFMLNYLIIIARERKIKALSATVMAKNNRMAKVFETAMIKPEILEEEDEIDYVFNLA
jgi:GNAT superfamily N-acetyltransferase